MKPMQLHDATRHMGAPSNWDSEKDGVCGTLDIHDRDGWMISAWEPSPAERAALLKGMPVYLWIRGASHPVVSVTVGEATKLQDIQNRI